MLHIWAFMACSTASFTFTFYVQKCVPAPSAKHQMTANVMRRSRFLGTQYGTWFVSHFWRLVRVDGISICGKFEHPLFKLQNEPWPFLSSHKNKLQFIVFTLTATKHTGSSDIAFLCCVREFRILVEVLTSLMTCRACPQSLQASVGIVR